MATDRDAAETRWDNPWGVDGGLADIRLMLVSAQIVFVLS